MLFHAFAVSRFFHQQERYKQSALKCSLKAVPEFQSVRQYG